MLNNKMSRNDLCPCGSGKKYKKCCLENAQSKSDPFVIRSEVANSEYCAVCGKSVNLVESSGVFGSSKADGVIMNLEEYDGKKYAVHMDKCMTVIEKLVKKKMSIEEGLKGLELK